MRCFKEHRHFRNNEILNSIEGVVGRVGNHCTRYIRLLPLPWRERIKGEGAMRH